jgi:hypothetical protein
MTEGIRSEKVELIPGLYLGLGGDSLKPSCGG